MSKKVNKKHIGVEKYNRILQMLIANARKIDFKYSFKDFQRKASELYGGYRNKSIKTITAKSVVEAKPVELKPTQRKYKGVTRINAIDVPNRWFDSIWNFFQIGEHLIDFSQAYPTIPIVIKSEENELSFVGAIEKYDGSILQEFTEKLRIEFDGNYQDNTFVGTKGQKGKGKRQFAFWGTENVDFPSVIEPRQISAETKELVDKREELIDTKRKLKKLEKKVIKQGEKKLLPKVKPVKPTLKKITKREPTTLKDKNRAKELLIEEFKLGLITKKEYRIKIKAIDEMFDKGGLIK